MSEIKTSEQLIINPAIRIIASGALASNSQGSIATRASQIGRRRLHSPKDPLGTDVLRSVPHTTHNRRPTADEISKKQQKNLAEISRSKNMWD
jgi:hypothetical protein